MQSGLYTTTAFAAAAAAVVTTNRPVCVCTLRSVTNLTPTGTQVLYGITQCYLPPGRDDIPALILGYDYAPTTVGFCLTNLFRYIFAQFAVGLSLKSNFLAYVTLGHDFYRPHRHPIC